MAQQTFNQNKPARSRAEAEIDSLQQAGSYDLSKDKTARRWAIWYPIIPRIANANIPNVIGNVLQNANLPAWAKNITSATIATGRTFIAQRFKFTLIPYNADTGAYVASTAGTVSTVMMQDAKNLFSSMYTKWGRQGAADGFDAEFPGAECLPLFSDSIAMATPTLTSHSMGTFGGDRAGEYRFTVPVVFGQTVQIVHSIDWGGNPLTVAPSLFTGSTANAAANWMFLFHVEGALTRLGV
jgi:hypothetical protein